jgi:hypothetical protein
MASGSHIATNIALISGLIGFGLILLWYTHRDDGCVKSICWAEMNKNGDCVICPYNPINDTRVNHQCTVNDGWRKCPTSEFPTLIPCYYFNMDMMNYCPLLQDSSPYIMAFIFGIAFLIFAILMFLMRKSDYQTPPTVPSEKPDIMGDYITTPLV